MRSLYALPLLVLITVSCAGPLQLVRLEPASDVPVDRYLYGNAILSARSANLTVEANYYDATPDYLVFDVQIINEGTRDILFDPARSSLVSELGGRQSAIDPEVQLFGMDWQRLKQQKANRTMAWVGAGLLVATTAYAIADASTVADATNNALTTSDVVAQISLSVADAMVFTVVNSAASSAPAVAPELPDPYNRFFWLDHSLRITTIRPGERAVGKLVFERMDDARELTLNVAAGEQEYAFPFAQRTLRPGRDEVATRVR